MKGQCYGTTRMEFSARSADSPRTPRFRLFNGESDEKRRKERRQLADDDRECGSFS
jgi:hypothetical protein